MARRIPGNRRTVEQVWFDADRQSKALAASMAAATAPFSPMAAGVHNRSTQARGYSGVPGMGFSGNRLLHDVGPFQNFTGAARKVSNPSWLRLGFGAGVSGQPGMPQSGQASYAGNQPYLRLGMSMG